ncbi:hypothetical protein B9Q01_07190 [Candidatus Marsarchaeota G1 archaeon OSP_D]|jgi:Zn-dependent hydrolases, including glyoxylases|uniref:Metallo-beta-lactamase domain-containing protein n=2 Tax=Candidatus Marsarchaeota group 1 TaxID=2203770 RepID=A0A2R6AIB9_9ARCH|nr:MAG: hypothetical protein B9Q01_07190 [Candidatus Marsarchaeota G1 archaeon OSP_D]PSN86089.1 MAG: hypothetical protein B9Q02_03680 [Candidatus Marsarchaeota G1 archaeon BE_D]
MKVEQILVGHMLNFSYVLYTADGVAAVVDTSFEPKKIFQLLTQKNLNLKYILSTHHHFDHVTGNEELASLTGAEIVAHSLSPISKDLRVEHDSVIKLGDEEIRVIHTPGHTKDSVCYLIPKGVFTGDTLFVGECGRVDLPGGSAREMYYSLFHKLSKLPDDTVVYPGHHYGETPTSTIGREKSTNYVLKPRSLEQFLEFMRT